MTNINDFFGGEEVSKKYALMDFSQICLAAAVVVFPPGEKITKDEMYNVVFNSLTHNIERAKSDGFNNIVLTFDNAKYGYWRRIYADYYKRNRAIAREEAQEKGTFDWDGYFEFLPEIIQGLKESFPYILLNIRHCEADDCIAVMTKFLTNQGHHVRIISSDGDFTQLHKFPNVDQWSPMQKKFVKCKLESPLHDCMSKVIKGDKKDCVSSVKVRQDFYLNHSDGERTPPTSSKVINSIVDIVKSVDNYDLDTFKPLIEQIFIDDMATKKKIEDVRPRLTQSLGIMNPAVEELDLEKTKKLIAKLQTNRFMHNRVLIDFDYIPDDITQSIVDEFINYEVQPRSKIYPFLVKHKLIKIIDKMNTL